MSYTCFDGQVGLVGLVALREIAEIDCENGGHRDGYVAMALVADMALARVEQLERKLRGREVTRPEGPGRAVTRRRPKPLPVASPDDRLSNVVALPRRPVPECGFCHGRPVHDAASWVDGARRPAAPCPRCGQTAGEGTVPA